VKVEIRNPKPERPARSEIRNNFAGSGTAFIAADDRPAFKGVRGLSPLPALFNAKLRHCKVAKWANSLKGPNCALDAPQRFGATFGRIAPNKTRHGHAKRVLKVVPWTVLVTSKGCLTDSGFEIRNPKSEIRDSQVVFA
jgi:hypothetical protein